MGNAASISAFIHEVLAEAAGSTPYPIRDLELALERYVRWAVGVGGFELDRALLLQRETIAYCVVRAFPGLSRASLGNARSMLHSVAHALTPRPFVPPLAASSASPPYSDRELVLMRAWAEGQSTPARRRSARVLLALGAGAGLSTGELDAVRPEDVHQGDVSVEVRVPGRRERHVPVLEDWTPFLCAAVEGAPADRPLFRYGSGDRRYANAVTNFVARSTGGPRPTAQRLRSTWIVHHLDAGAHIIDLMTWAGLTSLSPIERYLGFVRRDLDAETRSRALAANRSA